METRISFVDNYKMQNELVIRNISGAHTSDVKCDDVKCCCTRWEIYGVMGGKNLEIRTCEIPKCIIFKIIPLMKIFGMKQKYKFHMSCTHGCDFTSKLWGSREKGYFSYREIESMLSIAQWHCYEKHYLTCDSLETIEKKLAVRIRIDGYNDLEHGKHSFCCKLGASCHFPTCEERRRRGITLTKLSPSVAYKHHMMTVKEHLAVVASSKHPRLGMDSPFGIVDSSVFTQIISLTC